MPIWKFNYVLMQVKQRMGILFSDRKSIGKDGWQRLFELIQRLFWPSRLQTNAYSLPRDSSTVHPPHVSSHPSTTVVFIHQQTHSKGLALAIHGQSAKASDLRVAAIATASHTHMCGIRVQGSWVVLGVLNSALCHPILQKVTQKMQLFFSKSLSWIQFFHIEDNINQITWSHLWACSLNNLKS